MAVLPKYQLKELFEAGDLMTETTLGDFIDSAYNPTLVAGADILLTTVSTPSGDTITISSTGGGGSPVIAGDGINITTVGNDEQVSIDLNTSQTNLIFDGNDKLTFAGVHVKDEGVDVGTYPTINFVGADVLAAGSGTPGMVNVYIPPPTFASYFNTTSGTTNGECNCNITSFNNTPRISQPTTEGSPFNTGGGANALWAATNNKPAYTDAGSGTLTFTTVGDVTGFGGDSTMKVEVYDADGVGVLETYTTPPITGPGSNIAPGGRITVQISNYAADTGKFKAKPTITVNAGDVLTNNSLDGGRFHIKISHTTDTVTDTGSTYDYFGPNGNTLPNSQSYNASLQDVFFDTNLSTANIAGSVTIAESQTPANILTKHLSGVEYYILNSEWEIDVTDIQDFNANTQGRGGDSLWNFRLQDVPQQFGLPNIQVTAWNTPEFSGTNWPDFYDASDVDYSKTDWAINNTNFRYRGAAAIVNSAVYDPWGNDNLNSGPRTILVDTWTKCSTNLGEAFTDEEERLYRNTTASTYDVWDTTKLLGNPTQAPNATGTAGTFENGCTVGSKLLRGSQFFADNGDSPQVGTLIPDLTLYKPDKNGQNPDYSLLTNIPVYHRRFYTSNPLPISNVDLTFSGSFGTSVDATTALANSTMKIYIRREATNNAGSFGFNANPLAAHGALYNSGAPVNPFDDGASGVDTQGSLIRTGASSGNVVNFTFGGGTTLCEVGFWIEIQLVNSDINLDRINVQLNFSNGTNESNGASCL